MFEAPAAAFSGDDATAAHLRAHQAWMLLWMQRTGRRWAGDGPLRRAVNPADRHSPNRASFARPLDYEFVICASG